MASAGGGHKPRNEPTSEPKFVDEFAARMADGKLLDRIVEETLHTDVEGNDDAEDLRLLRQVAARFPRAPFELQPVGVEMVCALVGPQYRRLLESEEAWLAMMHAVTQTLFDDPRARQRLESLWQRLNERE
ncbi:MAG: hypothetical protein B7Z73_15320 [Planctomycetia bacterium 21-64-5]|nr:MAG: hypothetical protein B7Z73_15320 [Planctomycetia bacterium 21-64-5]